jgi:hypothetical protein
MFNAKLTAPYLPMWTYQSEPPYLYLQVLVRQQRAAAAGQRFIHTGEQAV